ncbi:10357_t:CDS:2 [Entrophospora sp. SA101]|nr:10357_t:CDS:2 [Entrophospora sp. SA101]
MLCMQSADVKNLRINRYKPSRHASSVEHYGVMNDRPIIPTPKSAPPIIKQEYEIEDIYDLYGDI